MDDEIMTIKKDEKLDEIDRRKLIEMLKEGGVENYTFEKSKNQEDNYKKYYIRYDVSVHEPVTDVTINFQLQTPYVIKDKSQFENSLDWLLAYLEDC